jgi:hypothetical protein
MVRIIVDAPSNEFQHKKIEMLWSTSYQNAWQVYM